VKTAAIQKWKYWKQEGSGYAKIVEACGVWINMTPEIRKNVRWFDTWIWLFWFLLGIFLASR
jgi:hypothetical protein